jgi:cytochrome c-type biogenesis protein CcmF
LLNNIVLMVAAASVLLGTLYPLVLDALDLGKISVGPPYFEAVFVPLMAPALFLMGVGPLARWKRSSLPELAVLLRWALGISLVLGLLLPFAFGDWHAMVGFGLALAIWVVAAALLTLKGWKQTRAHYGMVTAHIGVAVFVVGVTLVKGYESHEDLRMKPGESASLAGYVFHLDGVADVRGPNYVAARAKVEVTRGGRPVTVLYPERRIYRVQEQVMTEAAIDPGLTRDLYVSLGDPLPGGAWLVKIQHKPFIDWIWGGCLLMALGGAIAASDRRYRIAARRSQEQYAAVSAAP